MNTKAFWSVIRTHPNSEKIAIRNLKNQEFEYYQPLIMEKKLRKNKLQQVESPLFPCYLFVKIVNRWLVLQNTYGVASVISNNGMPAIVQDRIINDLKSRELNGYIQLPKNKQFDVGSRVKINSGSFYGQQALVERMNTKERQKILLALLQGGLKVLVNEDEVEAA